MTSRALQNGWPLIAGKPSTVSTGTAPPVQPAASAVLRENSGYLLREDGSRILREAA